MDELNQTKHEQFTWDITLCFHKNFQKFKSLTTTVPEPLIMCSCAPWSRQNYKILKCCPKALSFCLLSLDLEDFHL